MSRGRSGIGTRCLVLLVMAFSERHQVQALRARPKSSRIQPLRSDGSFGGMEAEAQREDGREKDEGGDKLSGHCCSTIPTLTGRLPMNVARNDKIAGNGYC